MNHSIKIAILDAVPERYWADDLGITDSQKFIDLLKPWNAKAEFDVYYVSKNQFPQTILPYDAILVTGSPCSVHDQHAWIARLSELVLEAFDLQRRIIGSCFGHQLIARAFGGEVGPNEQGWLIGNHRVHISRQLEWMQPSANSTGLYHFNQERVTRLPPQAEVYAHTDDYENYGYTIGDNVFSVQGHPEQPHRAMVNFLKSTPGLTVVERDKAEQNIASGVPDADIWAQWMMRFFTRSERVARRSA